MSAGDKKDWHEFNCSQEHEFTYVKNLYVESDDVYQWLKKACQNGILHDATHGEIYSLLDQAGFTKK